MIKKIVSAVICIAVLAAMTVTGFAVSKNTEFDDKKRVLGELGFSSGTYEDASEPVKRGDFAESLLKMMNASTVCPEKDIVFSDINIYHEKYDIMANAQKQGIICGENARPDDYVTYNEACKMVMCMLGYGGYAEVKGGWPSGYIVLAGEQGVLRGIKMFGSANLVYRDMTAMLFNALDASVMVPKSIGAVIEYEIDDSENILKRYHNIGTGEGIINGVKNKSLYDNVAYDDDTVLSDGVKYKSKISDISDFVGLNTLYYYDIDSSEIVAICGTGNRVVRLDPEDIFVYSGSELKFDENGREYTEKIAPDAVFMYNDAPAKKVSSSVFSDKQGEIRLVDNNSDGKADVVFMNIIEDFAVKIADSSSKTIYDLYESGKSVCLDDEGDGNISFTDEYGNIMFLSELVRYDVVCVRRSEDGKNIKAVFSNREVRGTVENIETTGSDMYVTIKGKTYKTTKAFAKNESLKIGDAAIFGLTMLDKIATVNRELSDSSSGLAYLINMKQSGGLGGELEVKLLTADNRIKIYKTADKVSVDGTPLTQNEVLAFFAAGGKVEGTVISYIANAQDRITDIDSPSKGVNESDNSLRMMYSSYVDANGVPKSEERLEWRSATGIFGSKIATSGKTAVFRVPDKNTGEDDRYITSDISYFVSNDKYAIEAYKTNPESHMADAVVLKSSESAETISDTTGIAVITGTSKTVNGEGELQEKIYYMNRNGEGSAPLKSNDALQKILKLDGSGAVHKLAEGDVIRFTTNDFAEVTAVELLYDRAGDNFKYPDNFYNSAAANSLYRVSLNEIYSMYAGNMLVYKGSIPGTGTVLSYDKLESYPANRFTVIVYDSSQRTDKVRMGKTSDLIDYKTAGKGSKIILYTAYTTNGVIVVYK